MTQPQHKLGHGQNGRAIYIKVIQKQLWKLILLSFPAHGPKRAYVALCALYPVCAELFLPYESSADRRPAKPKPLACYVESLQGQRNRQEYSIFCFTPSSGSSSAPPTQRPLKRHFTTKQ